MFERKSAQVIITVAVAIWAVMLLVQGATLDSSFLRPYSTVVGGTVLVLASFDRWAWRWRLVRRLHRRPYIGGTWRGVLQTTWVDPSSGRTPPAIDVFMVIRQTYSSVSTVTLTAESTSASLVATLDGAEAGSWVLSGTYLNRPKLLLQDRSRVHRGALLLDVHLEPDPMLEGGYWTDRDTKGSLCFDAFIPRRLATHFEGAKSLFGVALPS